MRLANACPRCGLEVVQWRENYGKGYISSDGETYCCVDCAQNTICTCTEDRGSRRLRRVRHER